MKTAFSTLACPGWTGGQIVAAALRWGITGVEIRDVEYDAGVSQITKQEQTGYLAEQIQAAGLEIPILATGNSLGLENSRDEFRRAAQLLELADQMGIPFLRVMITSVPSPAPVRFEQAAALYRKLCDLAAETKVCPLIETNGPLADSHEMLRFLDLAGRDNAGVLWDIHHPCRYFDETPADTFSRLKGWIRYVHLIDSKREGERVCYCVPGEGDIPLRDAVGCLVKSGYDGYFSLEWVKRWNPALPDLGDVLPRFCGILK